MLLGPVPISDETITWWRDAAVVAVAVRTFKSGARWIFEKNEDVDKLNFKKKVEGECKKILV